MPRPEWCCGYRVLRRAIWASSSSSVGRVSETGISLSVGNTGDAYDNALAETINGLYKTELIHKRGPWKSKAAVEPAIPLEWVLGSTIIGCWNPSVISRQPRPNSSIIDNLQPGQRTGFTLTKWPPRFPARFSTVYFLNSQKLSKNALLVRETTPQLDDDSQQPLDHMPPPDNRARTMWEILKNTIEDARLTLYLILDEAHRGMKNDGERATTVRRLINGTHGMPPIPIVWGISATVENFHRAMTQQRGRTTLPAVAVDPVRVQESGLLKDDIRLEFPAEAGSFNLALLRRATQKLRDASAQWADYHVQQNMPGDPLAPLMVVQMANKVTDTELQEAVAAIQEIWPELKDNALANVFGEHKTIDLPNATIPYVEPQLVQGRPFIRILFAKDAVSTGWDCPRAEVFISFRTAKDETYITQMLGRMVRTPLARSIPGNHLLNSVACVLPGFSSDTAKRVAKAILGDVPVGLRVLTDPQDMGPNTAIDDAVWAAYDGLPSETLPRDHARAVPRLLKFAQALAFDQLRANATKDAHAELCKVLDAFCVRHPEALEAALKEVQCMEGATLQANIHTKEIAELTGFRLEADFQAIHADYEAARRKLTPELGKRYAEMVAERDMGGDLLEAHIKVGAIGKMDGVIDALDKEADILFNQWHATHRVAIKALNDARRGEYDRIKGLAQEPQRVEMQRPRIRTENTKGEDGNVLPTRALHLMADADGRFPIGGLNDPEIRVLDNEMSREDFLAWYRNPPHASVDALCVPWQDGASKWRRMCPDFVFFHGSKDKVQVSIVDPHGNYLGDALGKLRGLCAFAERYGDEFFRIDAVDEIDGELRVLDIKDGATRKAIAQATDVGSVYRSILAAKYA